MDYSSFGFNQYGFSFNSLNTSSLNNYFSNTFTAMQRDLLEKSPYLNPISISRGTILTTQGGITEIKDATGGTTLFTVDPLTGTVTISGGVIVNQTLNVGTAVNSTLAGTVSNVGTFALGYANAGTIYNSAVGSCYIQGGTMSNTQFESIKFPVSSGSSALAFDGAFALQAYGTGVAIMARFGGTTFRFLPDGTI